MPVIRKVPKPKTRVLAKPKVAKGGINAILEKLKFANTPEERARYLKRLSVIRGKFKKGQFKRSQKKAA